MSDNLKSKSMDQLMAEADDLLRHLNSEVVKDMEDTHRLEFEKHAQHFQKIKSEAHGKGDADGAMETDSVAGGMHEAIQDIVKAFQDLKNRIF